MEIGWDCCDTLKAEYFFENSLLPTKSMSLNLDNGAILVNLEDNGNRVIIVKSDKSQNIDALYTVLTTLERLLVITEGVFPTLDNISVYYNGAIHEESEMINSQCKARRLSYYNSGKEFSLNDKLIDWNDYLDETIYEKWERLMGVLNTANQMFLYSTANTGLTVDVRCAFLIELSETLVQLLDEEKIYSNNIPLRGKDCSLKKHLAVLIKDYGLDIFQKEINYLRGKNVRKPENILAEPLKNTRVNIFHIKRQKDMYTKCLNGPEALIYMKKMSFLYRIIILKILGIGEHLYKNKLVRRISYFDRLNNTVDSFLGKF